jgi:hypothetical protein
MHKKSQEMKFTSFISKLPSCFLLFLLLQVLVSCYKDNNNDLLPEQPMIPIVMAHGLIGSGDAYELQLLRFASNGYPLEFLHTFEWNTLDPDFSGHVDALDVFIDEVLAATGFDQVDLVGHSYGTRLSMSYCSQTDRAKKVRNVVLMGGSAQTGPAGNAAIKVPTLNIWSPYDRVVSSGGDTPGATNLRLKQKDHFEVASCRESFEAMYQFFRNRPPATLAILPTGNPVISGKVVSFAENISGNGATLEIYEVDLNTGNRLSSTADAVFSIGPDNRWGPFQTKTNARYEFRVSTATAGDRPLRFYKESFLRDNHNVIIRYSPPEGSVFKLLFDLFPRDNNRPINVYFNASQTMITGRDQLTMNGINLTTPLFALHTHSTVALFMFDVNGNGISDGTPFPIVRSIPALAVGDFFFPVHPDSSTALIFNGRKIVMPSSRTQTDGVCIAVFD